MKHVEQIVFSTKEVPYLFSHVLLSTGSISIGMPLEDEGLIGAMFIKKRHEIIKHVQNRRGK